MALVEQDVILNGDNTKYTFIYNSKHNFFNISVLEEKKKLVPFIRNPLDKDLKGPIVIEDKDLTIVNFIEKVLDHCKFSETKGINDPENKNLNFRNFEKCQVKFVNYTKFENLNYDSFEKNRDLATYSKDKNINIVEKKTTENKQITKLEASNSNNGLENQTSAITNLSNKKEIITAIALTWDRSIDLIVGELKYNFQKNTGLIEFESTDEKCIGSLIILDDAGTWSLLCEKNKLTASGSLKISNGFITAEGIDNRRNKIKFISKKIYE